MLEVWQPSQLPADRGSVQALCSNKAAGIENVFLGQQELVAGLNTASFNFDPRCWGNGTTDMNLGVAIRTASNQVDRAAFLGYRFGGTFRTIASPVEPCDDGPDPSPAVLDPGILVRLINGSIRPGPIEGTWTRDVNLGGALLSASLIPIDRAFLIR